MANQYPELELAKQQLEVDLGACRLALSNALAALEALAQETRAFLRTSQTEAGRVALRARLLQGEDTAKLTRSLYPSLTEAERSNILDARARFLDQHPPGGSDEGTG